MFLKTEVSLKLSKNMSYGFPNTSFYQFDLQEGLRKHTVGYKLCVRSRRGLEQNVLNIKRI